MKKDDAMARTRTKTSGLSSPGIIKFWQGQGFNVSYPDPSTPLGEIVDTGTGITNHSLCVDTIMSPPYVTDHDLTITHRRVHPCRLYGRANAYSTSNSHQEFRGSIVGFGSYTACPTAVLPSASVMKTRALANMNPNRPVVDMTEFITQFTDLPRLVRNLGRMLISKSKRQSVAAQRSHVSDFGDAWLSWSFGWAPLISDAISLFDMPRQIELRKEYLRNLEGGTHLRRKIYSTHEEVLGAVSTLRHGKVFGSAAIERRLRTVTTVKSWFTANAQLQVPLPATPIEFARLASQSAYSLNFSPATAWELLPWSWLIDYFVNVGSFLDASNQDIPWKCTRMNVMTRVEIFQHLLQVNQRGTTTAWINSNGYAKTVSLNRKAYLNPTPSIGFLPLLTEGHMANISALAVSRIRNAR